MLLELDWSGRRWFVILGHVWLILVEVWTGMTDLGCSSWSDFGVCADVYLLGD